jgi:hypothetical protein
VNGAIDAHGKGGSQSILHAGGADGDGDDLGFDAALAQAESFFNAVLVHGVHDEFAVFESDCVVGDVHALFRIENLADVGQYAHDFILSFLCSFALTHSGYPALLTGTGIWRFSLAATLLDTGKHATRQQEKR